MLDFPASGAALWALFDAGGPRPEYILPVLWAESNFDPSIQNSQGAANYGINQASAALIAQYAGTDPPTYVTWAASQQIATVVRGFFLALVRAYGPLRSGARVEQANFLPSTLGAARSLSSVLTRFGEAAYTDNHELDTANKGYITIGDLAAFVRPKTAAAKQNVQAAIANTYELRPDQRSAMQDPVLGQDFGSSGLGMFAAASGFAFLWYAWSRG